MAPPGGVADEAAAATELDAEWGAFAQRVRHLALNLDGDRSAVSRFQQALDLALERELEALRRPGIGQLCSHLRERVTASPLLRLVAASVLVHLCALPVLAYFWLRPEPQPCIQIEWLPALDPVTLGNEQVAAPEPLQPAPKPLPLSLAASEAAELDEALRIDRFRRTQVPRFAPDSRNVAENRAGAERAVAELVRLRLASLAAGSASSADDLLAFGAPSLPELRWIHWSLACHLRLDRRADLEAPGQREQGRGEALIALEAELCAQLEQAPTAPALAAAHPADARLIADVLARAADFGLCGGSRRAGEFSGDPRRWLRHVIARTADLEAFWAGDPGAAWSAWAHAE
jgi:hypothetical protein